MQGFKKHLEEKLKASDDMGTWVKDFQDSDAPQFKGKSQKKRQQMAVAAKLSAERNEEVELDEKAYVSSLSPEMGRKGSHDVIGKDGKVVKSYPYTKDGMKAAQAHLSKMKEEVELGESNLTSDDLHRIAKDHDNAAKKHGTAYDQTRSTAAARNHEIAWNRHVDAAKAHREAAKDKSKHSH
jgi:ribonuclease D